MTARRRKASRSSSPRHTLPVSRPCTHKDEPLPRYVRPGRRCTIPGLVRGAGRAYTVIHDVLLAVTLWDRFSNGGDAQHIIDSIEAFVRSLAKEVRR